MIASPKRSVTRFFIPLIDVLILLFCIFLLMPFVSAPAKPEPEPETKAGPKPLSTDVKELQAQLSEALRRLKQFEKERARPADQYSARVLQIFDQEGHPDDGVLFYRDPDRRWVRSQADAELLILRQKSAAGKRGVLFIIPFTKRFPTTPQMDRIKEWFGEGRVQFIPSLTD